MGAAVRAVAVRADLRVGEAEHHLAARLRCELMQLLPPRGVQAERRRAEEQEERPEHRQEQDQEERADEGREPGGGDVGEEAFTCL